ncbi:hypothetical protein [Thiohalorhabdus sp.]|uniref:hypothetical protein n=1 Tax=Thiohalorhabdus sp. TaxID=3094134 RepID=UPI002FC2E143
MLQDFLNGVGNGFGLLLGLALSALFILWIGLPFLVLQLVRTNRALTTEVHRLRLLHQAEAEQGQSGHLTPSGPKEDGGSSIANEEDHHGE